MIPILFIEHATMYQVRGEVPEGEYTIPIGKSKVQRAGKDVTIVTYCKGLELSMKAAEELAKEGIEVEVVDLRTLRPLDMEPVIESFKKTTSRGGRRRRLEILRRRLRDRQPHLRRSI